VTEPLSFVSGPERNNLRLTGRVTEARTAQGAVASQSALSKLLAASVIATR
jgi:hypothetical protein